MNEKNVFFFNKKKEKKENPSSFIYSFIYFFWIIVIAVVFAWERHHSWGSAPNDGNSWWEQAKENSIPICSSCSTLSFIIIFF